MSFAWNADTMTMLSANVEVTGQPLGAAYGSGMFVI